LAKSPPRRRVFDLAITLACYRWEFLRRNSRYQLDVRLWIDSGCRVKRTGVIECPFDFTVRREYQADCAKWGLRLLLDPKVVVSEEEMAIYPIFADTPERQPVVKDWKALRRWVQRFPKRPTPKGEPYWGPKDLFKRGEPPSGPEISERDLRRYFRTERVPRQGFQLQGNRQHFRKFDFYLEVFDRRTRGQLFKEIAEVLGVSVHQAKRACHIARQLIEGFRFSKKAEESPQEHVSRCPKCSMVARTNRGDWCKKMDRLLAKYGRV